MKIVQSTTEDVERLEPESYEVGMWFWRLSKKGKMKILKTNPRYEGIIPPFGVSKLKPSWLVKEKS